MIVVVSYFAIYVATASLLYLIVSYLKGKPFGHQFVTYRLSIDFALVIFVGSSIYSWSIFWRELMGPLNKEALNVMQGSMLKTFLR